MKVRMKFTKSGPLKFIGHLDVMRYFQKAFRRADIDVEYSKGFSPHQLMSFAAPLGVGLTSDGEYLDVSLLSCEAPKVMIDKINEAMNDFIQVVDFKQLSDNSKNAMSSVAGADYLVSVKDGYDYMDKMVFEEKFQDFYNQKTLVVTKKSKKSENEVDIKPLIYHIAFGEKEFQETIRNSELREESSEFYKESSEFNKETSVSGIKDSVADSYINGITVYMQLATGSVNNLKPELVMEAFCQFAGIEYREFAYQVHRLEVYADVSNEENRVLVPLGSVD
ncbi:TIGR03936 family radical SAM-associated protein [Anaerocolumna sp. AGMB13025]|uniref:TIGR03936 family radical SAM-associated protein n=1 Tax=Anaerocolumna sp. AGMB13025 TaxID=3039116 RepID=UPI00241EF189|nr:TIGR03936 family radical SAM-associated protein [Anaerocolumna sp. AGMB13025]WFR60081.1 TIGR03936 family radical SAM-associated protein [Anaerocolumna sp. AGMB13025]